MLGRFVLGVIFLTWGSSTALAQRNVATLQEQSSRPWALGLGLSHAFGAGNFVQSAALREQADFVAQSWRFSVRRNFKVADHTLVARGQFRFLLNLTQPTTNPAYRFEPQNVTLSLSDFSLYREPETDIVFDGTFSLQLPTARGARRVEDQWGSFSLNGGATKSFDWLTLSYRLTLTKFVHGSRLARQATPVSRAGDPGVFSGGTGEAVALAQGFANTSFSITNGVQLMAQATEHWSFAYALSWAVGFEYQLFGEEDEFTSSFADPGRNLADRFGYSIQGIYALSKATKTWWDWPFNAFVSAGLGVGHATRSADNQRILWPLFYPAFGRRAGSNLASFFVSLSGVY